MVALLVVVAILAVAAIGASCFLVGRTLGRSPSSVHYGGIGRIREIGELVALRVDCSEVAWASEPDSAIGRGRSLLAKCDLVVEHRFNLRDVVIRPTVEGIELLVPEATVTIHHGEVQVVHMQHGTVLGVPCRRLGAADINRLLAEARANVSARREGRDGYLDSRAEESARSLLFSYAAILAPHDKVRIVFAGGRAAGTEPTLVAQQGESALPAVADETCREIGDWGMVGHNPRLKPEMRRRSRLPHTRFSTPA